MSNAVAKVSFLQGQAWAKAPDGSLRALTVGSTLNDDEILVTAQGARVELDVGNGEPLVVNGGAEVGMSRDFNADTATGTDEALLSDASVQEALTVLEQGGDLLEELEETAAGDNGGGGSNDGHSFVQLTRVIEQTGSQSFDYDSSSTGTAAIPVNDAGYVNRAPEVTDQALSSDEDEVLSGQIIATDIEGDQLTYTLTTPPANGTLVLDPVTGQFTFTPNANYNGPDSFVVTVTDNRGNSSVTNITLSIAPVNDAPTTNDINLTTDEDTPVNGQVIAQDIEGDTLSYVVSGQPANGTVTLDPVTGAFVYTPNANYNGGDSFIVTVSDGNGGTATSTITIGVNPVNDAPVSSNQNLVTDEDVAIGGQVVASDIDGDVLGYTVSGQPTNGTVTLNPVTGAFVYTPNANYNGSDSFVVTISDGNGGTTTSLITIGINPVNDAPVSNNQNLTTPEDTALPGQVVASDVDGDVLAYAVTGQPANGSVTLNPATGAFVYTPNANYNGSDSFVVTISDGNGGTTTSLITIGVTPVNDAPVASNLNLTTPENVPVNGQVSASDIDGDTLSFSVGGNPAHGTVTLNPATGSFTYTPNASYNGSDSFTVTVSDGNGGTTTSVVSIGVTPVNDPPVSSNLSLTTNEDVPVNGAVVATDADGDALSYTVSGSPANGTVVLNGATGTFTYTPNSGYNGSDSFVVTISDGKGGTTTSTVSIGVNSVNHAPVANDDTATTDEATAVTIAVRANDTDADGDALDVSGVTQGANGSVVIDGVTGNPVYTPNAGFVGSDSFTYTVRDGSGATSTATVTVTVNAVVPVNQAPVAMRDSITLDEGGTATILDGGSTSLLANDSDPENDPLTAILVSGPAHGTLTLNANGTFSYTHDGSETTTDSFTYKVNDGTSDGNTVTVNITVKPVNDAPISVADSIQVNEGGTVTVLVGGATSVLANDSDAENDPLSAVLVTGPANGTLTLNADGTFSYTHNGSETTTDSFTYRANDGTVNGNIVTVTINVTPVNDAPVASNDVVTVNEDGSVIVAVRTNDTDAEGDALTVNSVTQGANGSVVIDVVTGNPVYTPNSGFSGTDSFTYTVRDPSGAISNTATVTVTVSPANHVPVAVADSINVLEGGTATILVGGATSVLANDSDADGNALDAILVSAPTNGTLTLNADGTFSYTHNGSETTTDSFTYKVNDGTVDGNTVTVTINVTPVNDAPVAVDDFFTTAEDTAIAFNLSDLTANDSDPEGDTLTVFSAGVATHGSLSMVAGKLVFTPDAEFSGQASFQYSIHDGHGKVSTATVYITVTAVNDPSVLLPDTKTSPEDTIATGNVLSNDSDPDDVLQVASFTIDGNSYSAGDTAVIAGVGSFELLASGAYTFNPALDYNGAVPQVTYTTNTGFSSTLDITITPVNDAPVANDDYLTTTQNTPLEINLATLLANDTDVDGDTLTVFVVGAATNGTLSYVSGKLHFTPDANYTGPASFTYSMSDGHGGIDTATVHITVTAAPNVAPETNAVSAVGNEDSLITVTLSGSDSDGTVAGFVIKTLPANGVLYSDALMTSTISVGDVVSGPVYFMPNADWNGNTSFGYAARDNLGLEDSTPATASITVNPVADPAVIGGVTSGSVKEDTPAQSSASGTLTITDPDAGEAGFNPQTNVAQTYGTFSISAGGIWTYNIDNTKPVVQALKEGETKTEIITVTSIDGTPTNVVITITGTNDVPVAVADTANVNQDAVLTLTPAQLLANDTDVDGDTLTIDSVQGAVNGTVSLVGGNAVFTPTAGYSGPASFTYTVSDGKGGTATATVNVTVVKSNTPPDAVDDSGAPGNASNLGLVSEYFGYQEGTHGANLTTIEQIYSFINGRTPNATFVAKTFDYAAATFTNDLGFGTNLQTFLGSDAATLSADPATTTDAIIRMCGFVELAAGTYNFKVLADDGFQIRIDGRVVAEENRIQEATTSIHDPFTLTLGGLHSIEIIYWDQGGAAKFKVELSDNAGISYNLLSSKNVIQQTAFSVIEDTPATIPVASLLVNDTDADGDTLTITSVQGAVNGTVSLVGGNIIFTPAANYAGPASFTYTVSDGKGGTDTAKVSLSVTPVNDAPTAVNDSLTLTPDRATAIPVSTLLANDTDIEGDDLIVVSVQNATHGTVSLSNGNVTFTPTTGYEGAASFTYTIRDNQGLTSTATVNLMVAGAIAPSVVVNKAIVMNAIGGSGVSAAFPIITRLVDTDGSETLSIRVSGVPNAATFNAGTNLGGGVWSFIQSDLANLQISLPSNTQLNQYGIVLTIAVTSTESANNSTATTSTTVRLFADYTTNSITTSENGDSNGTSADDYIQGGSGNNTINGGAGNDLIYGGAGNDILHGGIGEDVIYGGTGNDTIYGGAGSDRISGGAGNDTLYGGTMGDTAADTTADVFVWSLGDQGIAGTPAVDTIHYFGTGAATANTSGDILDLRDLLQGESVGPANGAGNLANYLHFEVSGGNTIIHISHTGGFTADSHAVGGAYTSGAETQQIVLSGVNLQSLYGGAATDQLIITQLLNNNKLITD